MTKIDAKFSGKLDRCCQHIHAYLPKVPFTYERSQTREVMSRERRGSRGGSGGGNRRHLMRSTTFLFYPYRLHSTFPVRPAECLQSAPARGRQPSYPRSAIAFGRRSYSFRFHSSSPLPSTTEIHRDCTSLPPSVFSALHHTTASLSVTHLPRHY